MNTSPSPNEEATPRFEARLTKIAFERTGACFTFQDRSLRYLLIRNPPPALADREVQSDSGLFGAGDADRFASIKRSVLETGQMQTVELEVNGDDGPMAFHIRIEPVAYSGGTGILSLINDVTSARHREKVLKTLLRELSHRSKNLLAIIQGIATQTARQGLSLDVFLVKFRGRIQSLSNSQDLVTDSSWRGAFLFDLTSRQLAPYWPNAEIPIPFSGINAHLSPNAALHVGLALHELIVNSASHGAIASASGGLRINCSETQYDGERAILLEWTEARALGLVRNFMEDKNTFAHIVLERVVPVAIGGKSLYVTDGERVEYCLTIPEREFEITGE